MRKAREVGHVIRMQVGEEHPADIGGPQAGLIQLEGRGGAAIDEQGLLADLQGERRAPPAGMRRGNAATEHDQPRHNELLPQPGKRRDAALAADAAQCRRAPPSRLSGGRRLTATVAARRGRRRTRRPARPGRPGCEAADRARRGCLGVGTLCRGRRGDRESAGSSGSAPPRPRTAARPARRTSRTSCTASRLSTSIGPGGWPSRSTRRSPMASFPSVNPRADCMAQRYTNGTATSHTTRPV